MKRKSIDAAKAREAELMNVPPAVTPAMPLAA
jgi:hypothetical protein